LARRIEGIDNLFQENNRYRPSKVKETITWKLYNSYLSRIEKTPTTIVNQIPIGEQIGGGTGL
jgi:hypothetical protein